MGFAVGAMMDSCGRFFSTLTSRCANRRFVFAIAAISVFAAKGLHIYAHFPALSNDDIIFWGLSFFTQDVVLLMLLRLLLDRAVFGTVPFLRILAPTLGSICVVILLSLSAITISFFAIAGSEPHWRNSMSFAGEASAGKMMLTGLTSCLLVLAGIFVMAWLTQDILHYFFTLALDVLRWPFTFIWNRLPFVRRRRLHHVKYSNLPQNDMDGFAKEEDNRSDITDIRPTSRFTAFAYALVAATMFGLIFEYYARPQGGSLGFMSWTLPLLPFVDFVHSSPTLASLLPVYGNSINYSWDNQTALTEPYKMDWLPEEVEGFGDWYNDDPHYRGSADPMRISNLENDLLPELKDKLADIDIQHVMLIKLESTRKDVFPFKKDSYIWKKLAESWESKTLPNEAQERLRTTSPNANFITGDYEDGFDHPNKPRRGGLNMNNAFTTSTYTLKSMTGTFCGLSPLVVDFNVEWDSHIYQPCLPNIFEAFTQMDHSKDNKTDGFLGFGWESSFVQSVTGGYDKQDLLMPALGFPIENIITQEYLNGDNPKFGKPNVPDINYYGMPEYVIEPYIRESFRVAEKEGKRVFLGHLTSTSHHPFAIPETEKYISLSEDKKMQDLSKYMNAIAYVDGWLGRVLDILEEEGVANKTLLVFVGDHGLSTAENGGVTPYFAPNVANFHVPMVFSHPHLPPMDINDAVSSNQILPTILDLLLETGSLGDSEAKAARDLIKNYEGQSLIRKPQTYSNHTGQPQWQFTVMNPGRAQLSVRDARNPNWRLIVPIIDDIEWRYTDLTNDPHEMEGVRTFGFKEFLLDVEKKYSIEAANWAEEAAFMSRWWVEENSRRWRYDHSS